MYMIMICDSACAKISVVKRSSAVIVTNGHDNHQPPPPAAATDARNVNDAAAATGPIAQKTGDIETGVGGGDDKATHKLRADGSEPSPQDWHPRPAAHLPQPPCVQIHPPPPFGTGLTRPNRSGHTAKANKDHTADSRAKIPRSDGGTDGTAAG